MSFGTVLLCCNVRRHARIQREITLGKFDRTRRAYSTEDLEIGCVWKLQEGSREVQEIANAQEAITKICCRGD
jgi:hypothetical protein